jgi:hypothetical protein
MPLSTPFSLGPDLPLTASFVFFSDLPVTAGPTKVPA